ncbi:MAG TPA: alpha-1,4-glucan--maltose-1-phosphate maltosyltransferase [Solirubrobacteraceae bacterium]|nr:alpha-1,4-glucan--maltose-1-phosphate maltosyltransferase [Solirubrobacteraceae bacterium]
MSPRASKPDVAAATQTVARAVVRQPGASERPPSRIVIQFPAPAVDLGRYPVKRCVGDTIAASADVFRDGHDMLRAVVKYRRVDGSSRHWRESELHRIDAAQGGVRWAGRFEVDAPGRWQYTFEAWTDRFGTWRDELRRKVGAGQHDLAGELSEGIQLLRTAEERARTQRDRVVIQHALVVLEDGDTEEDERHAAALGTTLYDAVERDQERDGCTATDPLTLEVDRVRARFGSWYEMFPRSWGGLRGVEAQLPRLAELGFDVVYLPPIHPIGHTNRKGRDNALIAASGDPGSPWAIGDHSGGHDAIHAELGRMDDLRALTAAARELDIDIALDFAIQASADHPWLTEHPEWFHRRPDGTLKYAENPPKRYQDIYNFNWDTPDWRNLWDALAAVVVGWVRCGVKVFRVDNPHTKPAPFWAWLIEQVHAEDRDVIFLAEAFTRRAVMRHLAKIGFTQSYTYFTWKNARWELTEYLVELAYSGEQEYFRPNFFTNTPDILHEYLQHGGRPAFEARLVLAGTLSPSYGIYSGYENFENVAVREGSEEYLHSEKYEIKERSLDGPLLGMVQRLNLARRENPALQRLDNITFMGTENESILAYAKQTGANTVLTVVNLDAHNPQEGLAVVPAHLGLPPVFGVRDLLTGEHFEWRIGRNYVRLEPGVRQAHVNRVELV